VHHNPTRTGLGLCLDHRGAGPTAICLSSHKTIHISRGIPPYHFSTLQITSCAFHRRAARQTKLRTRISRVAAQLYAFFALTIHGSAQSASIDDRIPAVQPAASSGFHRNFCFRCRPICYSVVPPSRVPPYLQAHCVIVPTRTCVGLRCATTVLHPHNYAVRCSIKSDL
jgi:hypothetical protein